MTAPLFEYRPGLSLLHRLDPRAKLFTVCLFSITCAGAGVAGSVLFLGLLAWGLFRAGVPFKALRRGLFPFMVFLVCLILVRGLFAEAPPALSTPLFTLSLPGLIDGGLVALRFFNIMLLGLILCTVTRPSELNAALVWAARPLPWIPERRMGMIFTLALRFLPMIFREASVTRDAFLGRAGAGIRNPVRRIGLPALALVGRIFAQADDTGDAMATRCYTDDRTIFPIHPCGKEKPFLTAGVAVALILIFI